MQVRPHRVHLNSIARNTSSISVATDYYSDALVIWCGLARKANKKKWQSVNAGAIRSAMPEPPNYAPERVANKSEGHTDLIYKGRAVFLCDDLTEGESTRAVLPDFASSPPSLEARGALDAVSR